MNIAFVSTGSPEFDDYPDPDHGTSVQIWKLAKEYARRDHEVTIFYGNRENREVWDTAGGIAMVGIPKPTIDDAVNGLFTKLVFSRRVAEDLSDLGPDVTFLRERTTAVFPVRLPIPTIFTVISPDACDYFFRYSVSHHPANLLLFPYKRTIEQYVASRADATIVMNQGMQAYFRDRGIGPVHTVSIAIEENRFSGLGSDDTADRLLFVGRFDYNKRPDWLLEAYANLLPEADLNFVGSGPVESRLRQRIEKRGIGDRVTFHGWIDRADVLALMADSTGLVLPSRYENSPNVVLEAMAAGCPVVASDTRGARSMVDHRETGLLFDRTDRSDLEHQLRTLLERGDLRERLGRQGRTYALREHDVGRIADEYLAVYEAVT